MEELYINREKFDNYEDFYKNYKLTIPENFNFGYDIMDKLAEKKFYMNDGTCMDMKNKDCDCGRY